MRLTRYTNRWLLMFGILALALPASGCGGPDGPELGEVTGTVKLNGKPLENATVQFSPEKGRPSFGTTDANGVYTLQYTGSQDGAVLGTHTVRISTGVVGFEAEGEGAEGREGRDELVPPNYNRDSELKREVKAGGNTHDFDLESSGGAFPLQGEGAPPRQDA